MLSRAALVLALAGGLSSAALAGGDLRCGALLTVGDRGFSLADSGGTRVFELEEWRICFTCAGLPALRLALNDMTDGGKAWVSVAVQPCGPPEAPPAERYCLEDTGIQVGSRLGGQCRFPEKTTLGQLWAELTRSPPPEIVNGWWTHFRR
ncbi:hypothetical protein [Magnetospirillum sp. 15-1]|uniref:hypothetical protein n=1 Tax=Magnetospirillum sp. 15-1 TaxID=1979370 RepID=UPI000BBC2875|nr:hypothetical protein [Magnetospirillum sp. 15-1]